MKPKGDHPDYLGDGLYVSIDPSQQLILSAPREPEEHWVALEPEIFLAFLRYAYRVGWGEIINRAQRERAPK